MALSSSFFQKHKNVRNSAPKTVCSQVFTSTYSPAWPSVASVLTPLGPLTDLLPNPSYFSTLVQFIPHRFLLAALWGLLLGVAGDSTCEVWADTSAH